ncbi:MAG: magnesium/cobalt transporter CorA [Desulfatitalea sp.]|nr:magnesium/cobalt transporter CorA [Desulfatitalea sp.]NNK01858.1 magnesium/cobalt transporter CorA [Desulfatitalea sp.]
MPPKKKRHQVKVGSAPGTLIFVGEQRVDQARLVVMNYDGRHLDESSKDDIEQLLPMRDQPGTTWINVEGIHDMHLLERLGAGFGIHSLTLEDIANTSHRPKAEELHDYLFIVLKMLRPNVTSGQIVAEQVSLLLGHGFLISFQEAPGDVFEPVRERLRKGKGRIRSSGSDYLAYALVDAVVDHYYFILEQLDHRIEALEENLLTRKPDEQALQAIHHLRREVLYLQKQIWPLREVVGQLNKGEFDFISAGTRPFLSDVYDHVIHVLDAIENYREILSGLLELYLSTVSNRMNEVMKVLTIIATIFIPMTFVAGIYGMNFDFMPELHWRWGYWGVWAIIVAIAVVMLVYFRRKKWI